MGILSHEIAHVQLQHTSKKIIQLEKEKEKSWRYGLGGALVGAGVGAGLATAVCSGNSSCGTAFLGFGSATGMKAGFFAQKYIFLKRSQQEELEADLMGFALAENAGYSAAAMETIHPALPAHRNIVCRSGRGNP